MKIVDRIISPNIWNEVIIPRSTINTTTGLPVDSDNYSRSDYIEVDYDKTYYLYQTNTGQVMYYARYDANKGFINYSAVSVNGGTFTTTSETKYIIIWKYQWGNTKVCINISNPSINGTYYPYVMYNKYLCVDKSIVSVPSGYQSVDIKLSGNYGYVDMYNLTYYSMVVSGKTYYYANLVNNKTYTYNVLCSKYNAGSGYFTTLENGEITCNGGGGLSIWIRDDSVSSESELKAKVNGVYLIYELATPSNPTIVTANDKNKYCYHNSILGIYDSESETFRYNSNIEMSAYIKKYKIGDEEYAN